MSYIRKLFRARSPVGGNVAGYLALALDRLERRFGIVAEDTPGIRRRDWH